MAQNKISYQTKCNFSTTIDIFLTKVSVFNIDMNMVFKDEKFSNLEK